jgi:integrase
MNQTVTLYRRVKTSSSWKHLPASFGANGRVRPGYAVEAGKDVQYPGGGYELRYYAGKKTVFERVGDNAVDAVTKLKRKQATLSAIVVATDAGLKVEQKPAPTSINTALDAFVQAAQDRGAKEAALVYGSSVREFLEITKKQAADAITTEDMNRYQREMRRRKRSPRTIRNRFDHVLSFLAYCGLNKKAIAPQRPKYEKKTPEAYSAEELRSLFNAITEPKLYNTFQILLCAGLREQEAVYLHWTEINLKAAIVKVRSKPEYGFEIKDKEERDVPIPAALVKRLEAYRVEHPTERLVTGTKTDHPNHKLLRTLKRIVHNAGLGCGRCKGCLGPLHECHHWFLHRFRASAITTWHRAGMDMRTMMRLSGHSDMESIMRYLAPKRVEELRDQVDTIEWM